MKTMIAHGGAITLKHILMVDAPFQVHQECLRVLVLLSAVSEANFARCNGGACVGVSIEPTLVRVGLLTHTEYTLTVTANLTQTKLQKTAAVASSFDSKMRKLLDGVVTIPTLGNDATEASLNALFTCLYQPENFHRMNRVAEARSLFEEFLELDCRLMQVTRDFVLRSAERFACTHAHARSLPASLFHMLITMMAEGPLQQSFVEEKANQTTSFTINVNEVWMLSLLLYLIPGTSDTIAVALLRAIAEAMQKNPRVGTEMLAQPRFQACFLPLFFDSESRPEVFNLSIELFASLHVTQVLSVGRFTPATETANLLASTISTIGVYSSTGSASWTKRNIEIVQSVMGAIASALAPKLAEVPMKSSYHVWLAAVEVFNVYRNMVWLSLEQKDKPLAELLLSRPAAHRRNLVQEPGFTLMSLPLAKTLRQAMRNLKLFDVEDPPDNPELAKLMSSIKGWMLAFMAYFWDLVGCFRPESSPTVQLCVLAHFFGAYVFDTSYSKNEESRLRVLDDTRDDDDKDDEDDEDDYKANDIVALGAGIAAWQVQST